MSARILVVEDNAANLELIRFLLEAFGHTVLIAGDGVAGLESAFIERPDLILCDIQLPKMDGFELARRIKGLPAMREIPLVAVTALAMVGDRDKIIKAGFDGYIPKPIDPESFLASVEAFLPPQVRHGDQSSIIHVSSSSPSNPSEARCLQPMSGTILVVDDSPANLEVLCGTLEPFGYHVTAVDNVQAGLSHAKELRPSLIISDVHIRNESGYDFLRAIKADSDLSKIPFIFLSSTVWREEGRQSGLDLGADKVLLRPIEPQRLLAEIADCITRSS